MWLGFTVLILGRTCLHEKMFFLLFDDSVFFGDFSNENFYHKLIYLHKFSKIKSTNECLQAFELLAFYLI